MNNNKLSAGLIYLSANERIRLIHAVLKRLHISPQQLEYDDYLQDGCLIFAQAYATFPDDPTDPANERALMNFAYKRIYWRLMDRLRQCSRRQQQHLGSIDDPQASEQQLESWLLDPASQRSLDQLEQRSFWQELWCHCSPQQRRYLQCRLHADLSDSEIALAYGVSRQAVYLWKRGLIQTARRIAKEGAHRL